MKIQDLGEQGVLALVKGFCPPDIVGDDAAILSSVSQGRSLVVTTDMLVEGVHFSDRTTSGQDTGWRATAANLSDLAAMGAHPLGITVALGLQPDTPVTWLEHLYQGIADCLTQYHTPLVGGDVCRSAVNTLAITAFGEVDSQQAIRRSVAQPGQVIVATGFHGNSRAGLELLLHPQRGKSLRETERQFLQQAHQRPKPRLDVLPILQDLLKSHPSSAIAGMDSSDGLADAIVQICQASQVGAKIERNKILLSDALANLVPPPQALEWALYGGEDFELVLALPPDIGESLVKILGNGAAVIGTITSDPQIYLVDERETGFDIQLSLSQGFQHFS